MGTYRCGEFEIDPANRRFSRRGAEVAIEPKVLAVILQLLGRPGGLITRNELLDAVWGHRYVTPSTLNRVIALARRAFEDDTEEPRYIGTVHGAGYRFLGTIITEDATEALQPVRFAPPPTARLPARVEELIGRGEELQQIAELLRPQRALTVLGPGGIGKTQFALEAARRIGGEFPDGVWFFDLAPMQSHREWLGALASVLGVPTTNRDDPLVGVLRLLQGRHALLLLDNCDRIAEQVGALVIELLRGTDELKILATSQSPLSFAGEQLMRLAPLALPQHEIMDPADWHLVGTAPAVAMLLTRVRAVQPGFQLAEPNAETIASICRRLDGIPLALELAAARFALLSPDQVLQRLDDRFRFLSSAVAGRDGRHRNLQVLLEWSFALLSAEEQRLLTWFGVFVQGWSVESAIDLAGALGHSPEVAIELLTGLVNKSLVSVVASLSPPRYMLLETVREYALERLRAAEQELQARSAHLALVVRMTEAAHSDIMQGRMRQHIERLTHEHGNIEAALGYAHTRADGRSAALRIVGALMVYTTARGTYSTQLRWISRALDDAGESESGETARALLALGVAGVYVAAPVEASENALLEAARIAHLNGDLWTEGYAHGYYAMSLANGGRPDGATGSVARIEHIAAQLNDPFLRSLAGLARGWLLFSRNELAQAIEVLRAARDVGKDLHQRHFIEMYTALALFGLGETVAAAQRWFVAMQGAFEVANIRGVSGSIEGCGYLAARRGQWSDAARLLAAAAKVRERTQVPLFSFWLPFHGKAESAVRRELGAADYEHWSSIGRQMREEDAVNEARLRLQRFAAEDGSAKTPPGS
jgi:predicted ATPase/DNA-binding winged helix-turn-helix (wHTH) protein